MKNRSAKSKGKRLERFVKDAILSAFSELTEEDVRITVGCESGADVKLSGRAKSVFRYAIEAKNRETFGSLYKYYEQAKGHGIEEPLLVIKMNFKQPLAIISFEHFMNLIKEVNENAN